MGKITRPILPEVYPRKRLFEALDKLRRQPMIWISGPGGCGKTTLVSSYLEDRKIPCLWYQVEEGDKDPATFFYYLGQAAQKAFPRRKTRLPLFTPEYSRGLATFSLNYFEKLFNWVKIPSVLVFDNFQEAPEESPLPEILLNALSRILEGANLLVLSRKDPPESLIRLRANHQMGILGWDELRLSFGETEGIARLHDPELRSTETLQKFHIESDGWAAGLVLMVEGGKKIKGEINGLKRLSREDIFAYFAAEILQKAGPEIQDFLLKASLFPKMTVKMAEELTGNSTAGRILSRLNRDNYFTEKRIQEEAIYQFHPLFREFLLSRAEKLFSKEEAGDTKRRAAKILEENRQYEAAISLFQDLKDWEGMLGLTARQATPMLAQGRHLLLREWLQAIPERLLEDHPWHLFWMGATYFGFIPQNARSYFAKALEKFKSRWEIARMVWSISFLVHSIFHEADDFKQIDPLFPVFEELAGVIPQFPSEEIELGFAHAYFSALLFRRPHSPEAEHWVNRTLELAEKSSNLRLKISTLNSSLIYYVNKGNLARTAYIVDVLENIFRRADIPLAAQI